MLDQSSLCEDSSENMDFIFGKILEILHRQCLGEAKDFAKKQNAQNSGDNKDGTTAMEAASDDKPKKTNELRLADKYREAIYYLFQ